MRDGCPIQPLGVRRSSLVGQSRTAEAAGKRGAGGNGGASEGEKGTAVRSGCGSLVHGQEHAPQRPTVAAGSVTGHLPSWGEEPPPRPTSDDCHSRLLWPLPASTAQLASTLSVLGGRGHTSKCFVLACTLRGSPDPYLLGAGQLCSGER